MSLQVKRVYEAAQRGDGVRILVDRLWPRGLSKETAELDEWLRDCAPSAELRKWFGHDPDKWVEFRRRYFAELDANKDALEPIRAHEKRGRVSLLYAAKDDEHNNAVALKEYLQRRSRKRKAGK